MVVINVFYYTFSARYLPFDVIYMMDYLARTCLGFLIFIEIIMALKHLTFNYYVYLMRMTLNLVGQEMLSCTIVISVLITAYASFQYLTIGPYMSLFPRHGKLRHNINTNRNCLCKDEDLLSNRLCWYGFEQVDVCRFLFHRYSGYDERFYQHY